MGLTTILDKENLFRSYKCTAPYPRSIPPRSTSSSLKRFSLSLIRVLSSISHWSPIFLAPCTGSGISVRGREWFRMCNLDPQRAQIKLHMLTRHFRSLVSNRLWTDPGLWPTGWGPLQYRMISWWILIKVREVHQIE